jgi:hypothetical protein
MNAARDACVLMQVCRPLPPVDAHLGQVPRCDKGLERRACHLGLERK